MKRVIELFGGIGSCTQALKRSGIDFEVVDYVEVDKYPVASYNAMNGTNFEPQDISKWDKDISDIDLIMHGSPCQDFSVAGHGKGGDEGSGTRSSLMYETLRIVNKVKPKIVIWENVKGLLSPKHKHNFEAYLQRMQDMGYVNKYKVLNAKYFGVPQNRERIFTVSILGVNNHFEFPENQPLDKELIDVLQEYVDSKYYLSEKIQSRLVITDKTFSKDIIGHTKPDFRTIGQRDNVFNPNGIIGALTATDYKQPKQILDPSIKMIGMLDIKGNEQVRRVYGTDGICPTLNTMQGGNRQPKVLVSESKFIAASRGRNPKNPSDRTVGAPTVQMLEPNSHGICNTITSVQKDNYVCEINDNTLRIRKMTPLECWRVMGFDDEVFYKANEVNSDTQLYKQAGNSIVVNVLYEIIKQLQECGAL